jgi:DNA-binding transcriptional LysR family regulator
MQGLDWDDFRLVKMIAEHRGLGPAAELMKLNHSTVFRKLNALEDRLGTRVFERSRAGYTLTAAGEEMLAIAAQMAESVYDFERRLAGMDSRPTGELRVTTTDTIFSFLLAPIFADFRKQYPGIILDVVVDSRALNLSRRDADVAIRAATEPPDTLVGRRIGLLTWGFYRKNDGAPSSEKPPFEQNHGWIGFTDPVSSATAGRWFTERVPLERISARVNSICAMADAIRSGMGAGVLPNFVGDQIPEVIRMGPPIPEASSSLWLLTHPDLRRSVRMRAFLDFIGAELTKRRKLIEGEQPAR